jgi:hypothetical protein
MATGARVPDPERGIDTAPYHPQQSIKYGTVQGEYYLFAAVIIF